MRFRPYVPGVLLMVMLCPRPALAQEPPPPRIKVEGRVMVWGTAARQAAATETKTITDFLVRRARVAVEARVTDRLTANVQAGDDNIGAKVLTPDDGVVVKDAYLNYRVRDAVQLTAGQFKVPFLRANLESGFNQVLVDRGTLPGQRPARQGSRDVGLMLWGNQRALQYRVALFDGSDQDYAFSGPRVTARVAHNWFAAESGSSYTGTYLGSKRVVQVAVQADWQPERVDSKDEASFRTAPRDYRAFAVDAFAEQPMGTWTITAEAAWLNRRDKYLSVALAPRELRGYYGQVGVLLPEAVAHKRVQLAIRHENWDVERGAITSDNSRTTFGGSYFFAGHSRKLQADYTIKRESPEVPNDEIRTSFAVSF